MIKTIQQTLILTLCVLMPSLMKAATRSADDAKEIAAEFFQSGDDSRLGSKGALVLAHTVSDGKSNPICYVFNAKDGKGFVIISADDSAIPVVGYSSVASWEVKNAPGSAAAMIAEPVAMHSDTRRKMAQMRSGDLQSKLLETPSWSQESPFNFNIPNRRLTGCVGVALAEILKYHGLPAQRPASLVKDGEAASYAWSSMRMDNYRSGYSDEEAYAVATLVADAALAIGTDFGLSSSSAFEVKVPFALTFCFGYDAGVSYKKRSEMSKAAWDEVIVREINSGRPVLYCGQDVSSGHAFVCDGYEMRGGVPYFHINWGWGGSANGYYASDALNPVVSKAHSYNDLMTIVYNIKPAPNSMTWSDIHVTSDECQPGLTLDVADIRTVDAFTVRVGALKNISNTDFKGKLAVALFDAAGMQKALLSDARNFSLWALQISKYADFSCKVPSGVAVADGDHVGIVSMAGGASEWVPVAGDLLAPARVSATDYEVPYLTVTLPNSNSYYTITAQDSRAILGRDFVFTLTQLDPSRLITLKANGYILSPYSGNNYRLANLLENQRITVSNQIAATALAKKALWVTSGNLQNLLSDDECASLKELTLYGTINANDFQFMRDRMKLTKLDISQCSITALGSNPANAIPTKAFMGYRSLQEIVLPRNLTTFKNGCFGQTGLRSIDIPASVATWEYNVFANCTALREVIARRSAPAWVNWCVFVNTPQAKLIVPSGAAAAYGAKDYWKDFKEIVEGVPSYPNVFTVTVAERPGVKFTKITDEYDYWPGDPYEFKVETDDSFKDHVMQVFCNATVLTPDANGKYKATINSNSLIHVEFKQPAATTPDNTWKLTGDAGGIGLVTSVVNVPFNQNFTVRANAIKVPYGNDAAKFYAMVLTDSKGGIKEFISGIVSNYYSQEAKNITFNFNCKVKEATIQPDNRLRLATSYDKKTWQLVEAEADSILYSLPVINNPVRTHMVTMPSSVEGARIEGASSEVVRGMPFTVKASALAPTQRVTISVNGVDKAHQVPNATVTIPAVLEDLDIAISVSDAGAEDYHVFNIQQGKLAETLKDCPERVKLIGNMLVSDFDAIRANAGTIVDLDMSEVTVKGAMMTGNQIPENAFAPTSSSTESALKNIILPGSIERIAKNAFARCIRISELSIPAKVEYIGDAAFASCASLKRIIAKPKTAPTCGDANPFPSPSKNITLEVPTGSEESYSLKSTWWSLLTLADPNAAPKDIYWVKADPNRVRAYGDVDLNRIEVGEGNVSVMLTLPNNQSPSQFKGEEVLRPGEIFKIYDNGIDVFSNLGTYNDGNVTPAQSWSMVGGRMYLKWQPKAASGPWVPQNHVVDVVFFHRLSFENLDGAKGVKAEIVEMPEGCEWRNVAMHMFQYTDGKMMNQKVEPIVYREGSELKFQLDNVDAKTDYSAKAIVKVLVTPGKTPVYEEREIALESNGGIFTIPALEGDTRILISGVAKYTEEDVIPADAISDIKGEDAVAFSELVVDGEVDEEGFEAIRENFTTLETLDLSQIENDVIPEGAFAGMESLNSVIIPETVTEIGAGAFAGCEGIESITLPGVNSIGEGAFEGCSSLTSILIPASDGAPAVAGAPRRIGRNSGGISAESFRGLNPNCLIYIGSNEIPDSDDLNIILNKDGQRVAASDIHLDGNHSFNAPASFLLGDHKIFYTADVTASDACDVDGGWSTIMLPFQPSEMIIGKDFADREGSGVHLLSFDGEEAEMLTAQTQLLPNRPYLANVCAPFESVPVTFSASARVQDGDEIVYDVPFTPVPEETVAIGKDFSLYGSYDGQTRPVSIYMLNEDGSVFLREYSDSLSVRPFSAYLVANYGVDAAEMAVGEHPLWIHDPASTGLAGTKLYRSEKVEMASKSAKASVYYTVDGSDPKDPEGTRVLFSDPFSLEGDVMNIKAVAEYKGNVSDVVDLAFELKKTDIEYNLAQNWNWISQITESPVALADFATSGIDGILSQTQETVFDGKHGFVGSLTELSPAAGYKVRVSSDSWSGKLSGVAFDPTASVKLHKGWNWIGTPADGCSLLISDLLSGLEAEEGDMLVGLDGFVQADAEGEMLGTLTQMVPGEGYMFFSNSDKEFTYTLAPAAEADAPAKAPVAEGSWTVDNHKYASVMPVVAELTSAGGNMVEAEDYMVGAFCGDECRGIGVAVNGMMMINIHGNAGDMISFRIVDSLDREQQTTASVIFDEDMVTTFSAPLAIDIDSTTAVGEIGADGIGISYADGSLLFGGDLSDVKGIEAYDLAGKMIAKTVGGRSLSIGNLAGSVVTVVVRKADSASTVKVLIK